MGRVIPEVVSTQHLPESQQREAWTAWMAGVFEVERPVPGGAAGFSAENRIWSLGPLSVALAEAPALKVKRTAALVRGDPVDHWVLSLAGKPINVTLGDAEYRVPGATPFLVSLSDTFEAERPLDRRLHVYLPRDNFRNLASLEAASAILLNTPLGRLLASFLQGFASRLSDLSEDELRRAGEALRTMVDACIVPDPDRLAEAARHLDEARRLRIQAVIRRNLTSPDLAVAPLCRDVRISRTQLYRLFEGLGGVQRYIQLQRLRACHRAFADASDARPVHQVAAEYGFEDASSFSRRFRREFGESPSDVRKVRSMDRLTPAASRGSHGFIHRSLHDQLRSL